MVEEVEEPPGQPLLIPSQQRFGEVVGQGRAGAVEAEEGDGEFPAQGAVRAGAWPGIDQIAGREAQAEVGAEAQDLALDRTLVADLDRVREGVLDQAHGLEEMVAGGLGREPVEAAHTITRSPRRAGKANTSPWRTARAENSLKEFMLTLAEKKRSRMAARKNSSPVP